MRQMHSTKVKNVLWKHDFVEQPYMGPDVGYFEVKL